MAGGGVGAFDTFDTFDTVVSASASASVTVAVARHSTTLATVLGDYDIDARYQGNEMRFLNDPRSVREDGANAELSTFADCVKQHRIQLDLRGDFAVPVIACGEIDEDEEILLDYGKDWWDWWDTIKKRNKYG